MIHGSRKGVAIDTREPASQNLYAGSLWDPGQTTTILLRSTGSSAPVRRGWAGEPLRRWLVLRLRTTVGSSSQTCVLLDVFEGARDDAEAALGAEVVDQGAADEDDAAGQGAAEEDAAPDPSSSAHGDLCHGRG